MKRSLVVFLVLGAWRAHGATEFHRVAWRDDPATSAVICWNQVSGERPVVHYDTVDHGRRVESYGNSQAPDRVVPYRGMTNHFARLTMLKPDTAYYFIVADSEGASRRLWFKTAPDKPRPFTFIAGGDSRSNPEPRREGNKLVAKLRPLFVLFGGDYTGSGKPNEWRDWFEDWRLTTSEDGRVYPIIATHGNHENADMRMMTHLFDSPNPDQYYSMGFGGDMMRIWTLNSELEAKDPEKVPAQNAWIKTDLAKHADVNWKVVTYHRPMRAHTAGKAEGHNRIKWWANLFFEQGVDLVVESDTHMVKRGYPVRPSNEIGAYESFIRDDDNGFVFIGEGSWGAPARPANDDKPWTMASDSFHQFKWIQVYPDEMLIRTVRFAAADQVKPLTDRNLFEEPAGMTFWEPESGKVLRLPFDARHPSYSEPAPPRVLAEFGAEWEWSLDGTNWERGIAPLGYGDEKVKTAIASNGSKPLFALFRRDFVVDDPSRVTRLFLDVMADDGCEVKLNGKKVLRHNIAKGPITPDSLAQGKVVGAAESRSIPFPVDTKFLKSGENRLEVRVLQNSPKSSDLVFDLAVSVKE